MFALGIQLKFIGHVASISNFARVWCPFVWKARNFVVTEIVAVVTCHFVLAYTTKRAALSAELSMVHVVLYLVREVRCNWYINQLLLDIYHRVIFVPFTPLGAVTRSQHCVSSGHFRRGCNSCWNINVLDSRDTLLANAPNHRGNRSCWRWLWDTLLWQKDPLSQA